MGEGSKIEAWKDLYAGPERVWDLALFKSEERMEMFLKKSGSGKNWNIVDMHCHILPGVDDGAQDLSVAVSMLRLAVNEGISDVVLTPHYHLGRFEVDPETVWQRLLQLQRTADAEQIPIRLYPGNEVYFFHDIVTSLNQQKIFALNGTSYVLVEFSPVDLFRTIQNAAGMLLDAGYQPVLAHAERYQCLTDDPENVELLHDMGVKIQINASAVTGKSGKEANRFAHLLLEDDIVDFVGTDTHGSGRRIPEIARCREIIVKKYGEDCAYRVLRENACRLLGLQNE